MAWGGQLWAGGLARGGGDRRGGPCQVSVLSPLSMDQLADLTIDLFIHQTHLLEIDWAGLYLFSSGRGENLGM